MKALKNLFPIRPEEQRDVWVAFATLFGVIGSLSILETARDALFLSRVPATRLPWMYIALAFVSLVMAKGNARLSRFGGRIALSLTTFVSAAITIVFARFLHELGSAGVYAIYIWSSLSTALVVVRFWTLISSRFTVTQAKRLYGLIGAGSVIGAIAGSALARSFSERMSPRHVVTFAGFGFAATALIPLLFSRDSGRDSPPPAPEDDAKLGDLKGSAAYLGRQPYALRLVVAMSVSTACVTVGDYLFKSTAAQVVPRQELGEWFATVYLFLNIGSLFAQVFFTGWLMRKLSVPSAFKVLPALLLMGGVGMFITAGIVAALSLKAADGVLRYSLHKTSSEMLYLPFTDAARQRVKAVIDVIGQRGGQAVGSLVILGITAIGGSTRMLSLAIIVFAVAWLASAVALRPGYLGLFRGRLDGPSLGHLGAFPELDLASLETLLATLDSDRDAEVLAALDLLEREGKARVIPALILYHPSEAVVLRALGIFSRGHRTNVLGVIDRLLDHPSVSVRAAALAARSVLDKDPQPLLLRASVDDAPEVRATITVNLIASGQIYGEDARQRLRNIFDHGTKQTKIALAEAIEGRAAVGFVDSLVALGSDPDLDVRQAAIRAMKALHDPRFIPTALELLPTERTRPLARELLVTMGAPALEALVAALAEPGRSPSIRWRMAQVIPAFEPKAASDALLSLLTQEDDGAVRFQIIRGLEGIARRNPDITLDRKILDDAIDHTVRRAYRYLGRRVVLDRGAKEAPERSTPGHDLLRRVLDDKERNATDRLFRLLGLAHPLEDFMRIYRGINSGRREARDGAIELVANVLAEPLRGAVVGLVDEMSDEERLGAAGPYRAKVAADYGALLDELLESTSESVRSTAVFHVGELGLTQFIPHIEAIVQGDHEAPSANGSDAQRVLERLGKLAGLSGLMPNAMPKAVPT